MILIKLGMLMIFHFGNCPQSEFAVWDFLCEDCSESVAVIDILTHRVGIPLDNISLSS